MSTYEFSRISQNVWPVETKHRRIATGIPAPGTEEVLNRFASVESRSMHGQLPVQWTWAEDYTVQDFVGNKFIDFTSGIFVANVGHANARVLDSISNHRQLHAYTFPTETRAEYLEALTRWSGFDKAFLVSSGTEATEAALKLMRMHGTNIGKNKLGVVCLDGSFHGRTMGATMMSGINSNSAIINGIYHISIPNPLLPMNGLQHFFTISLGQLWDQGCDPERDVCGFMLETYQGWNAMFYRPDFVQSIERFCREKNILLCFDEIQAGFGRTGRKFGYEHYAVTPDLICVGKGMGGGLPLSGVLGRTDIMDLPAPGEMSSTHSANPLCCAAGLAVIQEMERMNLVAESDRKGFLLAKELKKMLARFPKRIDFISGNGLVGAVVFKGEQPAEFASRVAERCMQRGLLVVHTGRESVKLGPPLTIPDDALVEGAVVLAEAIADVEREK